MSVGGGSSGCGVHLLSGLLHHHVISGRAAVQSCNGESRFFLGASILNKCTTNCPKRVSLTCRASPNHHRRNPDFSRQQKGSPGGRSRPYQDPEDDEDLELIASKNGALTSLSTNPHHQYTATPGQKEKEIVQLFIEVQEKLRKRAANKEESKVDVAQGKGERANIDSVLELLRKHSMGTRNKSSGERDQNANQAERSNDFDNDQNSSFSGPDSNTRQESKETANTSFNRPASSFRRRSPVPRMKFHPVFSADEADAKPLETQSKKDAMYVPESVTSDEDAPLDTSPEMISDDQSYPSDIEESHEEFVEALSMESSEIKQPSVGNPDLVSLKVSELRELAKSRGFKGYSKLKKAELVELLSNAA